MLVSILQLGVRYSHLFFFSCDCREMDSNSLLICLFVVFQMMDDDVCHTGGCHCGAVRFRVLAPAVIKAVDCKWVFSI